MRKEIKKYGKEKAYPIQCGKCNKTGFRFDHKPEGVRISEYRIKVLCPACKRLYLKFLAVNRIKSSNLNNEIFLYNKIDKSGKRIQ